MTELKQQQEATPRVLRGLHGARYEVGEKPFYESTNTGALYAFSGEALLVYKELPEPLRTKGVEEYLRGLLNDTSRNLVMMRNQLSFPVDLVYEEEQFVGFVMSFMSAGCELIEFLGRYGHDKNVCSRVARNLCALVYLAKRYGCDIGRINPDRVRIDAKNCRVFLCGDFSRQISAWSEAGPRFNREGAKSTENPYDLVLVVYALLHGQESRSLLAKVWHPEEHLDQAYSGVDRADVSANAICDAVLESAEKPFIIELLEKLPVVGEVFEGPFWRDSAWEKRLFERYVAYRSQATANASLQLVAHDLFNELNSAHPDSYRPFDRAVEWIKRFVSSRRAQRNIMRRNERAIYGSGSMAASSTFWLTTVGVAVALSLFSILSGFSSLDALYLSMNQTKLPESLSQVKWMYVPTALAGCLVYNLFLTQPDKLRGYSRLDYCGSLMCTLLFMGFGRLVYSITAGVLS